MTLKDIMNQIEWHEYALGRVERRLSIEEIPVKKNWKSKNKRTKLQEAKENPFHYFTKLVEKEGFKLRIGDWRIISDINQSDKIIIILKVGHRKNIYKR